MTNIAYRECAHVYCCQVIMGAPGDLCDDCLEHDEHKDNVGKICPGCDHD